MAKRKRRKLYGAALAAHQKKAGGSRRRKPSKRRASARRRPVAAKRSYRRKHRYIPQTKYNKDGSRPQVKRSRAKVHKYMRNPRRKSRRNPGMFGMNQMGSTALQGLMGAGVILGTILAVGYANRQLERFQVTQVGWGNIAGKLAIAVAGGVAATWLVRKNKLSREMGYALTGAAFAPLLLGSVARFMPQLAAQVSLAEENGEMQAQLEAPMGPDSEAVAAELEAQLEEEAEASMF